MRKQLTVTFYLLLLFLALACFLWWLKGVMPAPWGTGLRWASTQHAVFILLPLCAMILLRRAPSLYGLNFSQLRRELAVGLAFVIWVAVLAFLAEALSSGVASAAIRIELNISTLLFAIVLNGFGEEIFYRGFYQGELTRVFPHRFTFGQTRFGWALVITAALFGLAHMFGQFNPLQGRFDLDFRPVIPIMVFGLIYGILREHFGGIIEVSFIHGGSYWALGLYGDSVAGKAGAILAEVLAYVYLGRLLLKERPPNPCPGRTHVAAHPLAADAEDRAAEDGR